MDKTQEPLVSICCTTYNHEKYIKDSIESFLMQETEFPFEIIIHDDASTDMTTAIIREYEKKYPELIKPIYQTENQYSKNRSIPLLASFKKAKGKYIAFCEGDDYWTDPKKLQIQFDCLEKNPNVVCCYHNAYVFSEKGIINESKLPSQQQRSHTSFEMMTCQCFILTLSIFFRNIDILRNYPPEANSYFASHDVFLFSILGQYGSGMYLPMIKPAAYRVHEAGVWSMKDEREKRIMHINVYYWLAEYYARLGNYPKVEKEFRKKCFFLVASEINVAPQLIMIVKLSFWNLLRRVKILLQC